MPDKIITLAANKMAAIHQHTVRNNDNNNRNNNILLEHNNCVSNNSTCLARPKTSSSILDSLKDAL